MIIVILFLFSLSMQLIGQQQQDMYQFISSFIKPGTLVFDVGAHVGNKTALYRAQGAQVVCIEPQPACCNVLQQKFSNDPHVTIEQVGLADKPGVLTLAIANASTLSTFSKEWQEKSRHKKAGYFWHDSLEVSVTTLDAMIKKYGMPYFCKIDVENFEYEVLKGLSKPITYLSFEFHIETIENAILCLNYLETIGYQKFNFAAGEYPRFIVPQWVDKNTLLQQIQSYALVYLQKENDPLWGDIYANYP